MKFVLLAALLSSTISVNALAEIDYDDCTASQFIKSAHLECVTCGAQKYYADKFPDKEVIPSEKWLAFLGVMVKQTSHLAPSRTDGRFVARDNDIVTNEEALAAYHKKVIAQVQAYGFCSKFVAKNSKSGKEVSSEDWKRIFPHLTSKKNSSEDELQDLAKYFGFIDSGGRTAESNMRYLATGKRVNPARETEATRMNDFGEDPKKDRRLKFGSRLSDILGRTENASGERIDSTGGVASGDKSTGLRECLEEIRAMQEGRGNSIAASIYRNENNSFEFCSTMAKSCDVTDGFCAGTPLPSATAFPVKNRKVVGKDLPPAEPLPSRSRNISEGLAGSLNEGSQFTSGPTGDTVKGKR